METRDPFPGLKASKKGNFLKFPPTVITIYVDYVYVENVENCYFFAQISAIRQAECVRARKKGSKLLIIRLLQLALADIIIFQVHFLRRKTLVIPSVLTRRTH